MAQKPNQTGMIGQKVNQAPAERKEPQSLKDWVQVMMPQISKALPSVMTAERFTRMVLTALSANPRLAQCTRDSFLGGMMQAAQLGLEPNTPLGQAYLIPYRNNKKGVMECQFQIGYKGLIDLAYRSGEVATVQAHCVYQNDEFEYELGLDAKLRHVPAMKNRGDMTHVYAVIKLTNGGYAFEVMSADDVRKHAQKFSKAVNDGPWQTNFDEMAKKTILKKVLKYAPLKSEFARGVMADEGTLKQNFDTDTIEVAYDVSDAEPHEEAHEDAPPANMNPRTGEIMDDVLPGQVGFE
jgi:recombination protein RecT